MRGICSKEEELGHLLMESNVDISVITESKQKFIGTKDTKNYSDIYTGIKEIYTPNLESLFGSIDHCQNQ